MLKVREGRSFALDWSLAQGGLSQGKWRISAIFTAGQARTAAMRQRYRLVSLPGGAQHHRNDREQPAEFALCFANRTCG